jgi:hypothetical protein
MANKDGSVMWNFVQKLDKKYYYLNIPRYTDEEARKLVQSRLEKILVSDTDHIKLRDLRDKQKDFTCLRSKKVIWLAGHLEG